MQERERIQERGIIQERGRTQEREELLVCLICVLLRSFYLCGGGAASAPAHADIFRPKAPALGWNLRNMF